MSGRLATNIVEERADLNHCDDGNFWALSITYEGTITALRFDQVVDAPFPAAQWDELRSEWISSHSQSEYCNYVEEVRHAIARGDLYQANACRILTTQSDQSLDGLFAAIVAQHPAPYAGFLRHGDREIASASPELFLQRDGEVVRNSPIKGTRALNSPAFGKKDSSENIMIVDLMRNDLGQICTEVTTPHLLREEEHPGLIHLVSDVQGRLKPGLSWREILDPLLPAGSISGAPKSSAVKIIEKHEGVRGPYCGILGWVQADQGLLNVAIRTFWREKNLLKFGTGAGITWSSEPEKEWHETELKAARLLAIAGGAR